MLEMATRSKPTTMIMVDKWRDSAQHKSVKERVREYKETLALRNALQPVGLDSKVSLREFAPPFSEQLLIVAKRCFQQYWRTPSYFWVSALEPPSPLDFPSECHRTQSKAFRPIYLPYSLVMTLFSNIMQLVMPKFTADRALYESRERQSKTHC